MVEAASWLAGAREVVRAGTFRFNFEQQSGDTLVSQFEADAEGGKKPGMAESMGVGALTGHLVTAAAVGGGMTVVGEEWTATVDAGTSRMAKAIAKNLKDYFAG